MNTIRALAATLALIFACAAHAAERKQLEDVDVAALTGEIQKMANADGMHFIWWIPREYWAASALNERDMKSAEVEEFLKTLGDYSMLAVAQGDVSMMGAITFFDRDTIAKGMRIEVYDGKTRRVIEPVQKIPQNLQMLLTVMAPMLESALGQTGKNLNFFVLPDTSRDSKDGRLVSPYGNSTLTVTLAGKKGEALPPFVFEFPLDSLYVPRMCPNGKPAHVSWAVCPWDGSKLPL